MLKNKVTGTTITENEYFNGLLKSLKENWERLLADRFDGEYTGIVDTNPDYDFAYREYIRNATKELIE